MYCGMRCSSSVGACSRIAAREAAGVASHAACAATALRSACSTVARRRHATCRRFRGDRPDWSRDVGAAGVAPGTSGVARQSPVSRR
jgi:hypothetical protein